MKRLFSACLAMLLLLCQFGCQQDDTQTLVNYYYPKADYGYSSETNTFEQSIIALEQRDNMGYQSTARLLSVYLDGPLDPALINPFPQELAVVSVHNDGLTLQLTVSDQLAQLTGLELIIACSCLARTGMELTNTAAVELRCESALLDGNASITIQENTVIFEDIITPPAPAEE